MAKLLQPAPDFTGTAVVNCEFKEIKFVKYRGKYVVLLFYSMDFSYVSLTEIIAFSDRAEEFRKMSCEIIAISTDSQYTHLAWINTPREQRGIGKINIPLLSDKSGKISRAYKVFDEETGIAFSGLFIVDRKGILRQITINDIQVGRSVDEALRMVQALDYTDKFGESLFL